MQSKIVPAQSILAPRLKAMFCDVLCIAVLLVIMVIGFQLYAKTIHDQWLMRSNHATNSACSIGKVYAIIATLPATIGSSSFSSCYGGFIASNSYQLANAYRVFMLMGIFMITSGYFYVFHSRGAQTPGEKWQNLRLNPPGNSGALLLRSVLSGMFAYWLLVYPFLLLAAISMPFMYG